jgi:hypothetical protein
MSIRELADRSVDRILTLHHVRAANVRPSPEAPAAPPAGSNTAGAIEALIKYIPTESMALYIAAVAAIPSLEALYDAGSLRVVRASVYWGFALLVTPLLFVLILFAKRRESGLKPVPPRKEFPLWDFVAATVAFSVWAILIPNGPIDSAALGIIGPVVAIAASVLLNLIGRIVTNAA